MTNGTDGATDAFEWPKDHGDKPMTDNPRNPPAYPVGNAVDCYDGMTMRQYYKAAAMPSLFQYGHRECPIIAKLSGEIADAMLAEDARHEAEQK